MSIKRTTLSLLTLLFAGNSFADTAIESKNDERIAVNMNFYKLNKDSVRVGAQYRFDNAVYLFDSLGFEVSENRYQKNSDPLDKSTISVPEYYVYAYRDLPSINDINFFTKMSFGYFSFKDNHTNKETKLNPVETSLGLKVNGHNASLNMGVGLRWLGLKEPVQIGSEVIRDDFAIFSSFGFGFYF